MTQRRPSDKGIKTSSKEAIDKARLSLLLLVTGIVLITVGVLHSLGYF